MRILFLTPQIPYPPHQGAAIRNFNLIAHLAARHTVDLITFAPHDIVRSGLPDAHPLKTHCRRIALVNPPVRGMAKRLASTLFSPRPDMAYRLDAPDFHAQVQAWLADGEYDILQIEGIELVQYARHVKSPQPVVIFDEHNCEYLLQRRAALSDLRTPRRWHAAAYSLLQWSKLRVYEAHACRAATAVVAVSRPDAAALQRIAPAARIHVAPNAIVLEDYPPAPVTDNREAPFTILFTGKMDYRPNIDAVLWFASNVWPELTQAIPDVRWQIVGMNPHPRLDRLRALPGIEITGAVPEILPYLHACDAFIIPMRVGGGTRFKALEGMAVAKPIVSTRLGVEGIDVKTDQELLLADTPTDFVTALRRLADDRARGSSLANALGQNARRFVAAHYTWDRIIPSLESFYRGVLPTVP